MIFKNRTEAGQELAAKIIESEFSQKDDLFVVAVSQNGTAIGKELSRKLNCPFLPFSENIKLEGKFVLLADDGIATGATMVKILKSTWLKNPHRVIVAVPVIAKEALSRIEQLADEVIYLEAPEVFISLSEFYNEF